MTLDAYFAAFNTAVDLGADHDACATLDRIEHDYPDEFHRICLTIRNAISRETHP
jgi:hypothetical protein